MNKKKLYFAEYDEEYCYSLEHHIEQAKENGLDALVLFEAKKYKESYYFWCIEIGEYGEKDGKTCGKICDTYTPRNGKSGICKHYSDTMYEVGERVVYDLKENKFAEL